MKPPGEVAADALTKRWKTRIALEHAIKIKPDGDDEAIALAGMIEALRWADSELTKYDVDPTAVCLHIILTRKIAELEKS
jgi:hypothetical protein